MNRDQPHEHPAHFSRAPFLHPRPHAALRAALMSIDKHLIDWEERLRDLEARCSTIDWLADLSRHLVYGNKDARKLFRGWLHACSCDYDAGEEHGGVKPQRRATRHAGVHHEGTDEPVMPMPSSDHIVFNLAPLIDVFVGIAYEAGPDAERLARDLANLRAYISGFAPSIELIYLAASKPLPRELRHGALYFALKACGKGLEVVHASMEALRDDAVPPDMGKDAMSAHTGPLAMLDRLIEAWKNSNPVSEWQKRISEAALNASLAGVSSSSSAVGDTLELFALKEKCFTEEAPPDTAIFFFPGIPATIKQWSAISISTSVPEGAQSGYVSFGKLLSGEDIKAIDASARGIAALVGSSWDKAFLSMYPATSFVHPQESFNRNSMVHILRPPIIEEFVMLDAAGVRLQSLPAEPDTVVRLTWRVTSDTPATTRVRILVSGTEIHNILSTEGSFPMRVSQIMPPQPDDNREPEDVRVTLEVDDGRQPVVNDLFEAGLAMLRSLAFIGDYARVTIGPTRPTGGRSPASSLLFFRLSHAASRDLTVTFTSTDGRVEVESPVVVPRGERRWFTRILARDIGSSGEPTAIITASAPGYVEAWVEVWVEPTDGTWKIVGPESDPLTLPLIAIHAALLHTGEILFFSGDEIDHENVDKGKWALWNPVTEQVTHSAVLSRNLFCAGHCFLADGRLLVAGGHASSSLFRGVMTLFTTVFFGPHTLLGFQRGADHDVHIFDPRVSPERAWSRLEDMRNARWYPACTTLPNGRALIVSGSRGGAPPWPFFTINEDYDVVDPDSGLMTFTNRSFLSHPDMYPFLHVLPGGALFFHSRDITRLFFPDDTITGPLERRVSNHLYPTLSLTTRTYPGQAACVMLPLIPGSDNRVTRARLLVIGGGGSLHSTIRGEAHLPHKEEMAVNTCEIFDFDASLDPTELQSGWRRAGSLTHGRFMSDGVLLPDGSVLAVGGTGKGKADDNDLPRLQAELFDPTAESWKPMAEMRFDRRYHSTALLLPDGRVLSAGGTAGWPPRSGTNEFRLEIFHPPYLYRGPRPQIESVSPNPRYNEIFTIVTPDSHRVHSVGLIRASSTTHTLNTDQRYVQLLIEGKGPREVRVRGPYDNTIAPPGWYMLFLLTQNKIPSPGQFVQFVLSA